jgi:hypothetical protein
MAPQRTLAASADGFLILGKSLAGSPDFENTYCESPAGRASMYSAVMETSDCIYESALMNVLLTPYTWRLSLLLLSALPLTVNLVCHFMRRESVNAQKSVDYRVLDKVIFPQSESTQTP